MDKIKITKDLSFGYEDLMLEVDFETEFTLLDIVNSCMNSRIPIDNLSEILHCPYLYDYWDEAHNSPDPDIDSDIEYLRISWYGSKNTWDGKRDDSSGWIFDGIGRAGHIPSDMEDHCSVADIEKLKADGWRQTYAIELTPLYNLADYVIRIDDKITITDYDLENKYVDDKIDIIPSITLIELLYSIFWELSFMGSPKRRDEKKEELGQLVKDIKDGKVETVPWDEAKDRLKKKFDLDKED